MEHLQVKYEANKAQETGNLVS